jgi:hypothetical protein
MMEEMRNTNLKEMREVIKSGQAEMRSILKAWIADMKKDQKETVSCQITMEACLVQGAKSGRHEMRSGTSGGLNGRGCSQIFGNNEEAAEGPTSSCRTTWRPKGTDLRRLWILQEVGCHLQEGVSSCSSGMVQEKCLQENSDPGKLWTTEGIGRTWQEGDPKYKSGTAQGTLWQEIRRGQCGTRNPGRTDVQEETEGSRMQQ